MPVLVDTESLVDLLRASTPETDATNGTSTGNGSLNTSQISLANEADEFEMAWRKKQTVAVEALKSRFGNLDALNVAKVLLAMAPDTCSQHAPSLSQRCLTISMPAIKGMRWACLTAMHPRLSHNLDEFVERVTKLRMSFGERLNMTLTIPTANVPIRRVGNTFRRKSIVREGLEDLEHIRTRVRQDQEQVNVLFDEYLRPVAKGISAMIDGQRRFLVELDLREDTLEEAIERGGNMYPPGYEQEKPVHSLESPPYPYRDQSYPRIHHFSSKPTTYKMLYSFRSHGLYHASQRRLGSARVVSVFMSIFCITGLAANILAVYKCSPSDRLPAIDSNFWSALSQTTIGIAAIYSLMIPQLQSGWSPIPRKWRWLFNSFLVLSVLTALLATAVYPWYGRVSIVAAFISALTQLAVTLQMILSSGQKIRNVRIALDRLGNSDINEVRKILDSWQRARMSSRPKLESTDIQ